ncbi:fibronectin type III domain-containing protein [Frankia sp. AgB1.9]|uniref:fibronectin type III domain-containing protein n=1 Tax=unclassified Frankia TaxID=2632575 RepID=UPI0019311FAC|nr:MULTISPECIES: fibronectin type III domain-containing protein [unclassified Frankia]MBL7489630.1 fibronectin type III domain-containing protein [Frankia sp. AgW1.1]MBL7547337.1 fibronectin type III domain-containing protein [Frankia sp. AgB1.9]MBL7618736.1 fibronectin type III domain-containing protein [Frankia sp. AgB1.8]
MAFDPAKYRATVLAPLAKDKARTEALQQVIRDLQGAAGLAAVARLDMVTLFAVEPSMSAADLANHLERLVAAFNKNKNLASAQLLKRLVELIGKAGGKVSDPSFWANLAAARQGVLRAQLDDLAQELAQEFSLKVITPEQVAEQVASAGLGAQAEGPLQAALAKHGVNVRPDFELPKVTVPAPLRKVVEFPEFRTVVDVITRPKRLEDIAVVDELSYGSPARRLEPSDVAAAKLRLQQQEAQVEERARHAAQNALAALTQYTSPAGLHAVTLALLADTVRDLLGRGRSRLTVRNELMRRGVREVDAARLVAKLASSTQVLRSADVADRLAAGALAEARRLFDALPAPDGADASERAAVEATLVTAEKKKATFQSQYDAAMATRNYAAAATALRGALTVDTADEDLRRRLTALPPLPPLTLSLRVEGRALDVTWPGGEEGSRYSVVRTLGAVPVHHSDGEVLAGNLTTTRHRDPRPPVGRQVRYAVFVTRDGVSYSDPVTATAVVLPAPTALRADAQADAVSLSWSTPPEAAGVVVTQTALDGAQQALRPTTPGQLSVTGLALGTRYLFSVRAVYLLPGGERRESAATEADVTPRGVIRPVDDLRLETATDAGYQASWSPVAGYGVELWALPVTAQVTTGARLSFTALESQGGRRLALRPAQAAGGRTARTLDPMPDVRLLAPVTVDGDGGLVGPSTVIGNVPSVRRPAADRFGSELRLSWEWPRGDYLVEVRWSVGGGPRVQRVSRAGYDQDGGVRLADAEAVSDVTVATVVRAGSREWLSPAAVVPVPGGGTPRVGYSLAVRRSAFRGLGSVTVTIEPGPFRGTVAALVVLREAKFPPGSPANGTVVERRVVNLATGEPVSFTLDLGKVASPFWIRLFPDAGSDVRFADPPTSDMRG